jgi:hypothetical protein
VLTKYEAPQKLARPIPDSRAGGKTGIGSPPGEGREIERKVMQNKQQLEERKNLEALDAWLHSYVHSPLTNSIIFARSGVTLVVDGQALDADLSYHDAIVWEGIIWGSFPDADIDIDWR